MVGKVHSLSDCGEIDVKLSLCLSKHHEMNKNVEVEIYFDTFLTSALRFFLNILYIPEIMDIIP
jgi:hypothetical protein